MRLLIATRARAVGVEDGRIVAPEGRFDATVALPDAELRPGLINAHDHLHRNHYGRLGAPPYCNAYDWAHDIQRRYRRRIAHRRRMPRREALLAGAWKNLFAGVTTVVHHDAWEADFDRDFPVRVARVRSADSLGMTPEAATGAADAPFCLHVAEGVDDAAADEVRMLDRAGRLTRDLVAVHGVGVDPDGTERVHAAGAAIVWCATSNLFLFRRTAPAALLDRADVLLGSDSRLTGAGDLLDELRTARALGVLDDRRLEQAVGDTAARRLGLAAPALEPGAPADLVLLARPLLKARAEDVLLVLVGGAVCVAAPSIVPALGPLATGGRRMRVGAVVRWTSAHAPDGRIS